ncbi:hypothetical protein KKE45_02650 [Patescibacteria group bacterium]|nr:hypothetical protein [Patescibacteria group bacterium]
MLFDNPLQAANQLSQKLKYEHLPPNSLVTAITKKGEYFAKPISQNLNLKYNFLFSLFSAPNQLLQTNSLILIDDGSTNAQEYNEYTDKIRKINPKIQIILAIPIIPTTEEKLLKKNCDRLIYLHSEKLFFDIKQFYKNTFNIY